VRGTRIAVSMLRQSLSKIRSLTCGYRRIRT
jgi:hypothetical protein